MGLRTVRFGELGVLVLFASMVKAVTMLSDDGKMSRIMRTSVHEMCISATTKESNHNHDSYSLVGSQYCISLHDLFLETLRDIMNRFSVTCSHVMYRVEGSLNTADQVARSKHVKRHVAKSIHVLVILIYSDTARKVGL